MTLSDIKLTRRSVLRGVGVTMAIPWLESRRGRRSELAAAPSRPSRRVASPPCSWAMASVPTIGGRKVPARRCN